MLYEQKQAIIRLSDHTGVLKAFGNDADKIKQLAIKEVLDNETSDWLINKLNDFAFPFNENGKFKKTWSAQANSASEVVQLIKKYN